MDTFNPESSPAPAARETSDLHDQVRHLETLLLITLGALIILALAIGGFIFKQLRMVQQNLVEQRPAVQRLVTDYQRASEPLIRDFSSALVQFASTNQDFRPILDKYRPVLSNYMGAPLPVVRPAATPSNP